MGRGIIIINFLKYIIFIHNKYYIRPRNPQVGWTTPPGGWGILVSFGVGVGESELFTTKAKDIVKS